MHARAPILEDRNGTEEVQRVLLEGVPRDQADQQGVWSDAELAAHLEPRRRVGAKGTGVEPVGDNHQLLGRVAPLLVQPSGRLGAADDPGGQPT